MAENTVKFVSSSGIVKILIFVLGVAAGILSAYVLAKAQYLRADHSDRNYLFECSSRLTDPTKAKCPLVWPVPISLAIIWISVAFSMTTFLYFMDRKQTLRGGRNTRITIVKSTTEFLLTVGPFPFLFLSGVLLLIYGAQGEMFDCQPSVQSFKYQLQLAHELRKETDLALDSVFQGSLLCSISDAKQTWFFIDYSFAAGIISIITSILYLICGFL